ncbi:hypothetical protein WMQ62_23175 [Vibrio diabolicus]|uniref:hypothetical protein n=1 Tax=Vibrio diabolicus TaxID=50719 RepID=UPI0037527846
MLSVLARIAAISVIICGVLYTSSVAYYGGYLHVFSLDADILHRNVDQVLYYGFIFLYPRLINIATALFIIACVVMLCLAIATKYKYRKLKHVKPNLLKLACYDFNTIKPYLKSWLFLSLLLFVTLVVYILILANFERQGMERGNEVKDAIAEGNVFNLQCIERLDEKSYDKLVIKLYCGASSCVGIPLNSNSFIYYETKNIAISNFDDESKCGLREK